MRSTPPRDRRSPRSAAERTAARQGAISLDALPLTDGVITLRPFETSDARAISRACRDPEIARWTFMVQGLTVREARDWIRRAEDARQYGRAMRFAVVDANDATFLGQAGIGSLDWHNLVGEVFYWVVAEERGRGIASRAARLVADWAFTSLGLARVELTVDPANASSQRAAERAGFTREGVLRSYQRFKDGRMDAVMFSRLPGDE